MHEALVTQQFTDPDDLRPVTTFGQAVRELVDVDKELAVDLCIAGLEGGQTSAGMSSTGACTGMAASVVKTDAAPNSCRRADRGGL